MSKIDIDYFMNATATWKEIMLKNFNAALAEESKTEPFSLEAIGKIQTAWKMGYEAAKEEMAEQAQPVAWMDREGDLYKMPEIEGWAPPHTLLYTAQLQRESVAALLVQSKQNHERMFGPSCAADWIYSDLFELLETAPPQREWQDLTNEEIEWIKGSANRAIGYIRVTAAKLKEKNT